MSDQPMCQYLTGVSNDYTMEAAENELWGKLGILIGPATGGGIGSKCDYKEHIPSYRNWACDNGCFANGGDFDRCLWLQLLDETVNWIDGAHEACLFAVAPDVYDPVAGRGDWAATIERSLPVLPKIRGIGIPAALVFQDGIEDHLDQVPWDEFDVAFIGGGDGFKTGYCSGVGTPTYTYDRADGRTQRWASLINEIHAHDKGLHVGRVNGGVRHHLSRSIGADSVDGTSVARGGEQALRKITQWLTNDSFKGNDT